MGGPASMPAIGIVRSLGFLHRLHPRRPPSCLLLCFGLPAVPGCEDEDVNGDGNVNVLDLIDVLLLFGTPCP